MENLEEYRNRESQRKFIEKELERMGKYLLVCQRKREKTFNLYLENYIEEKIYKKTIDELVEEETEYNREIERLSQLLLNEEEKEERELYIKKLYKRLKLNLENANYNIKCDVLHKLIGRIKITGDLLTIEYNLPFNKGCPIPTSYFYHDKRRVGRVI